MKYEKFYAVRRADGTIVGVQGKVTGHKTDIDKAFLVFAGVLNGEPILAAYEGTVPFMSDQRDGDYLDVEFAASKIVFTEG